MKLSEYIDLNLGQVHDIVFMDINNNEITPSLSCYDQCDVVDVSFRIIAIVKVK
jgi:hypothetical protein